MNRYQWEKLVQDVARIMGSDTHALVELTHDGTLIVLTTKDEIDLRDYTK